MGKKVKKKGRTPQKDKRVVSQAQKNVSLPSNPSVETVDDGVSVVKERKPCPHLEKSVDFDRLSAKFGSAEPVRCEDCREGAADRRVGKGKGKHGKKKGSASGDSKSESKAIWICVECGHYSCGAVGLPISPQFHAFRHARQTRHPIVIQFEKPLLRWCFPCNSLLQVEKEENGEHKDVFSEVVKLIKGRATEGQGSAVNAEDVCFGSGSVTAEIKSSSALSNDLDGGSGYVARGLMNLGNTCFFNSIIQNLFALDRLRDYFMNLDASVGPVTVSLKKLYAETKPEAGLKNVINPRALFGCICSKAPQFRGYQQQDSHELLRCLLDGLSSEELGLRKRMNSSKENGTSVSPDPTFVDAAFGGQVSSTVCCLECGHSSTVYEPFLDLSLPVPTKKPPPRKAQQAARAKKAKLPPKKVGKFRSKAKGADSVSAASTSRELSCELQSGSSCPTAAPEENASVLSNSSAVNESANKQVIEDAVEQTSTVFDDSTWLDFLEPEAPSEDAVVSMIQDSENNDTFRNCVSTETHSESSAQCFSLNGETAVNPESSTVNSWEEDSPLPVQSSQILLLPYKEENCTVVEFGEAEASSSVLGGGEDDFDGFGGLFNEPEVAAGPIAGPSLNNEVTETWFSESDPDEVDNSDSPVSVESCLAHFIKPELLSDDNAWHCENCSKTLLRQKLEAKKKQSKTAPRSSVNENGTRSQSDPINVDKDLCNNGNTKIDSGCDQFDSQTNCSGQNHSPKENGQRCELTPFDSQGEERKIETKDEVQEESHSLSSYNTCNKESLSDQAIMDSGCVNETSSAASINDRVQGESELLAKNHEGEESVDDEINSKNVKVMREAAKRVLISKAPPILTIHLKRFSQDARGRLSKLNGHVIFKEIIDLKPYMDARSVNEEKYEYRLVGVVEHSGTLKGGHYIAYVRGRGKAGKDDDDKSVWFYASDAYVKQCSLEEVFGCDAYILFYEKV
ncbi:hypothetical protein UlMin_010332 [Ulmus minor]